MLYILPLYLWCWTPSLAFCPYRAKKPYICNLEDTTLYIVVICLLPCQWSQ